MDVEEAACEIANVESVGTDDSVGDCAFIFGAFGTLTRVLEGRGVASWEKRSCSRVALRLEQELGRGEREAEGDSGEQE